MNMNQSVHELPNHMKTNKDQRKLEGCRNEDKVVNMNIITNYKVFFLIT